MRHATCSEGLRIAVRGGLRRVARWDGRECDGVSQQGSMDPRHVDHSGMRRGATDRSEGHYEGWIAVLAACDEGMRIMAARGENLGSDSGFGSEGKINA